MDKIWYVTVMEAPFRFWACKFVKCQITNYIQYFSYYVTPDPIASFSNCSNVFLPPILNFMPADISVSWSLYLT